MFANMQSSKLNQLTRNNGQLVMVCLEARHVKKHDHGFNAIFHSFGSNHILLGCSGPLDNARTIPEWLTNKLKKLAKKFTILYQNRSEL